MHFATSLVPKIPRTSFPLGMCVGALGTPKDFELPQSFLMSLHLHSDSGGTASSRVSEVLLLMGTAGDSGVQAGTRGRP